MGRESISESMQIEDAFSALGCLERVSGGVIDYLACVRKMLRTYNVHSHRATFIVVQKLLRRKEKQVYFAEKAMVNLAYAAISDETGLTADS